MEVNAQPKEKVLDDKNNLLKDVLTAFKEGFCSDITFFMADNKKITTSKFMLASRVPYFATMLFGGLAGNRETDCIPLTCCDSDIFKQILKFAGEGEISFRDMSMKSLLDLMETARLFCMDILVEGIVNYLKSLLGEEQVDLRDCLIALEFTNCHKFTSVSEILVNFIDRNLSSVSSLPEFECLSESSLKLVLGYEGKISTEKERFPAFTKWLTKKENLSSKNQILSFFDLRKFDRKDLLNAILKTHLSFNDEVICGIIEEHFFKLENQIRVKDERIIEKNKELLEKDAQIREKDKIIKARDTLIKDKDERLRRNTALLKDIQSTLDIQLHFSAKPNKAKPAKSSWGFTKKGK